jgi:hypothetical protein
MAVVLWPRTFSPNDRRDQLTRGHGPHIDSPAAPRWRFTHRRSSATTAVPGSRSSESGPIHGKAPSSPLSVRSARRTFGSSPRSAFACSR